MNMYSLIQRILSSLFTYWMQEEKEGKKGVLGLFYSGRHKEVFPYFENF